MSSGDSIFCKDETTVAGQVTLVAVTDPAGSEAVQAISAKHAELNSARAGVNNAAQGGK